MGILDNPDGRTQEKLVKLSSKGRYAVRALFDIAFYNEGRPTQVKDIADRQSIPPRFLEQIFQDLKRAGIVGSKRGPQGGYLLARAAEKIPLGEVISIIEGPISLGDPGAGDARPIAPRKPTEGEATDGQRVIDSVFEDLSTKIAACLDGVTLADVCEKANHLGLRRSGSETSVYFI